MRGGTGGSAPLFGPGLRLRGGAGKVGPSKNRDAFNTTLRTFKLSPNFRSSYSQCRTSSGAKVAKFIAMLIASRELDL